MIVSRQVGQNENDEGPPAKVYQSSKPATGLGRGHGGKDTGSAPIVTARPGREGLGVPEGDRGDAWISNGAKGAVLVGLTESCGRTSALDEALRLCPCPGGFRVEGGKVSNGAKDKCLLLWYIDSFVLLEKDF